MGAVIAQFICIMFSIGLGVTLLAVALDAADNRDYSGVIVIGLAALTALFIWLACLV